MRIAVNPLTESENAPFRPAFYRLRLREIDNLEGERKREIMDGFIAIEGCAFMVCKLGGKFVGKRTGKLCECAWFPGSPLRRLKGYSAAGL